METVADSIHSADTTKLDVFAQLMPDGSWTLQMGRPFSPFKIAPSRERSGPHLMHGYLNPNGISIGSTVLRSSWLWQTDDATPSLTIGRIYVVLRCGR